MRRLSLILLLLSFALNLTAQVGGRSSFEFLNLSPVARLTALGGQNVSLRDKDQAFFVTNPALVGDSLASIGTVSYQNFVGGINQGFISYTHNFKRAGAFSFAVQHLNYGEIQGYDPTGLETSLYKSGETALVVSRSHTIGNFRLGVNMKGVFSNIVGYRASALMIDVGGIFIHPEKPFTIGMVIKNAGFMLSRYSDQTKNRTPFDVQVGATVKPEHMPIRFSMTASNLATPDASYDDPSDAEKSNMVQKIFGHLNIGAEILFHKNVNVLVGYNFLQHQALKLPQGGGSAGLALGFSAHIKTVDFIFSRNTMVAGRAGYTFTLATPIFKTAKRRTI